MDSTLRVVGTLCYGDIGAVVNVTEQTPLDDLLKQYVILTIRRSPALPNRRSLGDRGANISAVLSSDEEASSHADSRTETQPDSS